MENEKTQPQIQQMDDAVKEYKEARAAAEAASAKKDEASARLIEALNEYGADTYSSLNHELKVTISKRKEYPEMPYEVMHQYKKHKADMDKVKKDWQDESEWTYGEPHIRATVYTED